ncbi:uncharacterized protein TNCV_2934721 [Trichonephila clavipes]|nr:uncharacterized protein TNCV_2934721 [Trichonephila clavipes]
MAMKNAVLTTDFSSLYDELESKSRALESLGRSQEKYGDFLSPLMEFCLPEEIIIAWKRFRNLNEATDGKRSLEQLLSFLNKEVRGEQLIRFQQFRTCPIRFCFWFLKKTGYLAKIRSGLGNCSDVGPNLLEHISDILDSFRSYPTGVSADIEKAFHQLGISFEQRDFSRFFYPKEGDPSGGSPSLGECGFHAPEVP